MIVSLAERMKSKTVKTSQISLMWIRKSRGPRMEPGGAPHLIFELDELNPLNWKKMLFIV